MAEVHAAHAIGAALLGFVLFSFGLPAEVALAQPARTQGYPDRAITIVVSVPPNGLSMRLADTLAGPLERIFSVPVHVSSRPGENGFLGARSVVKAPPDGYTLLLGPSSLFLFDYATMPDAGYVPERDLDTIMMAIRSPYVLVVNPSLPVRDLKEFIAYVKAHPGRVDFGARWAGSINDLLTAQFWATTGMSGRLSYIADVQVMKASLGSGKIQVAFQNLGDITTEVRAGRLRAIAMTSDDRSPLFSNVPTFTEEGLPDLDAFTWQAIAAPAGLAPEVRKRLEDGLRAALLDRTVMATVDALGSEVAAMDSRQFARALADARRRWRAMLLPAPGPR